MRRALVASFVLVVAGAAAAAQSYVPNRVFSTDAKKFADFEVMSADLAKADVVFVGEQHDDPNTHRLELAVLEALARRGRSVVLSLEMFERDVQESLEHFAMGHVPEAEFLAGARPWPRYATDYKPLVDLAIAKQWPIVAANVPRRIASEVAKGGLDVLKSTSDQERALFARDLSCPLGDEYFKRFVEAMGSHPAQGAAGDEARRTAERYYYAQCVKDETMAESIASAHDAASRAAASARPVIVHVNGAFHSDYGLGTASRVKRRLSNARVAIVSIKPVPNLDALPDADRKIGDWIVYTTRK